MKTARNEMISMLTELDLCYKEPCSAFKNSEFDMMIKQKQKLPEGVYQYEQPNYGYYKLVKSDLSEEEINRFIILKQTKYLYTIRNSMIFFVTLTIITLVIWLLISLT